MKATRVLVDFGNKIAQCWQVWPDEEGDYTLVPAEQHQRLVAALDQSLGIRAWLGVAERTLKSISDHRQRCWDYDDDTVGYAHRRSFSDEAEWNRVETEALEALARINAARGVKNN